MTVFAAQYDFILQIYDLFLQIYNFSLVNTQVYSQSIWFYFSHRGPDQQNLPPAFPFLLIFFFRQFMAG